MKKTVFNRMAGLFGLIIFFSFTQAGIGQTHDLGIGTGSLVLTINSAFASRSNRLIYPQEYNVFRFPQNCARGGGIIIGAKDFPAKAYYPLGFNDPSKGWVIGDSLFPQYIVDSMSWYNYDLEHTTVPILGAHKRYWKYAPTARIINGVDLSSSQWEPAYETVNPALPTEQAGVSSCHTALGITVTERAYVFGNPDFDDFAIVEYVFRNTGQTGSVGRDGTPIVYPKNALKDCFLGVSFWPVISDTRVVPRSGGWAEGTDDWVEYTRTEDKDTLRVLYGWDGDAGSSYQNEDDEGDPLIFSSGVFLSSQYPGMAVLHADLAPGNPANDMNQPHLSYVTYGGYLANNALSMGNNGPGLAGIYEILKNGGNLTPALDWQKWKTNRTEEWLRGTRYPTEQYNQIGTLAFGPYQFRNIGDSVRVVLCYTVGTIGWARSIELGAQWKARSISAVEKNATLRSGRDSLFAKIKKIKTLFRGANGRYDFSIQSIAGKIAPPPAWPARQELSSEVGGCGVEWSPVAGAVAYRVYRRLQPFFYAETPGTETYRVVFQCGGTRPAGDVEYSPDAVTRWTDKNVAPAQHYWYYVTAVNAQGIESSQFVTRTEPTLTNTDYGSVTPYESSPADLKGVYVVPNPYHVKAASRLYGRPENLLDFVGLPASCRIRIFTQSGELVTTLNHAYQFPPSSTETWEMRTSMDQTIASGVYIYVVDEAQDYEGNSIRQSKRAKFVVIR